MIRFLLLVLLVLGGSFCSLADSFRLEGLEGESYHPSTNVEIIWQATNGLPRGLWIYKIIPQSFSMAVVSNLMVIGKFDWKNITRMPDPFIPDKNLFRFRDKKQNWTRYLEIAPTLGWIEYSSDSDPNFKIRTEEVPSKIEVEKLASDVLFQLGIDGALLCDKRNGYESIQGKLSHDGQKLTTNVVSRGISYARKVDGIQSRGICFMINFEGHSKIARFWLNWRDLLPYEAHLVATPDEIIDSIKVGRAILPMQSYDLTDINKAKKLEVAEIQLTYFDNGGMKPLDFTYPYAELKMVADFGNTNPATFYLDCPILSTNLFTIGTQSH